MALPANLLGQAACAISMILSRVIVPTRSGWSAWTCASTLATSSSSVSPRSVSPQGQSTSLAMILLRSGRSLRCGYLHAELGQRLLGSFLLGGLLRFAAADAELLSLDHRGGGETAIVRG